MEFKDIGGPDGLPEDERIKLIGEKAVRDKLVVGFFVDDDSIEPGKADRYIRKLLERYPELRVVHKSSTLEGVVLVKVSARPICIECGKAAKWRRRTQFAGSHPFCSEHAQREADFKQEGTIWEEIS